MANTGNVYPKWQVNAGGLGGWDATERVLTSHCEAGWSVEVRRCFASAPAEYGHPQPIDDCANMLSADERTAFERDNAAAKAEQTKQIEAEEAAGARGK